MALISEIIRDCGIKKPTFNSTLIAFIVGMGFGACGLFLFTDQFLKPYLAAKHAEKWISTNAQILRSQLIRNGETSKIDIEYRYTFKNESHTSNRFGPTHDNNLGGSANEKLAAKYPVGSTTYAFVNPDNPAESVINRELKFTNWMALLGSIPFLTVGLSALVFAIFGGIAFRIQRQAWKEAAHIASRHSAFFINKALLDEDFNHRERTDINFLKYERFLQSTAYFLGLLFVNGIISVFVILAIGMHINNHAFAYPLSIFLIPFVIIGFTFIRKFFTSLFASKGDDYVIISKWDYEYTQVTHHWLLLSDPRNAQEIGLFTCATQKSKELKKILKTNPFTDIFKAPDKAIITGTISHQIRGSKEKEINLLVYTINNLKKKPKRHQLTLFTPDND